MRHEGRAALLREAHGGTPRTNLPAPDAVNVVEVNVGQLMHGPRQTEVGGMQRVASEIGARQLASAAPILGTSL